MTAKDNESDKIFTATRIIFGAIITLLVSILGYFGTKVTASSTVNKELYDFKLETVKEIGEVKGNVQTLQSVNTDINRRLEGIEGNLQTLTSYILKK